MSDWSRTGLLDHRTLAGRKMKGSPMTSSGSSRSAKMMAASTPSASAAVIVPRPQLRRLPYLDQEYCLAHGAVFGM